MTNKSMRAALEAIGIGRDRHERRALRSLIHELTGAPPPDHKSADELALMVLDIEGAKRGELPREAGNPTGRAPTF
jgi:hypothetical protein